MSLGSRCAGECARGWRRELPALWRRGSRMAKLNQIIAVEKGIKSRSFQELTEAHQALQKPAQLAGISRTYRPKDEEGEGLPPESTQVQINADDIVRHTD